MSVLRERDFRLLFLGSSGSWFGDRMVNIALAFAVLGLDGSASDIGIVFAARAAPLVACLLAGGVVADRVPRRALMVVCDVVRLAAHGLMAGLLIAGAAEIWMLAVLAGIGGAATGFFSPASTGLMPAVVAPEQLQQANGLRAIGQGAGEIGGPVLAGLLVASVGAGWAMAVDAATFGLSAVCLLALRLPPHLPPAAKTFIADLREGWSAFVSRRWVWSFVAAAMLGNACWGAWSVLGPVIAERDFGGPAAWGLILGVFGAGSLVGGVIAVVWTPRRPVVVATLTVGLFSLPLAFLALGVSAPVVALSAGLSGAGLMLSNTIWESTIQRHIPQETLSRVSAYDWFGSLAIQPVGMAIWGPIAAAIGFGASLWIAFSVQVLAALALLAIREVRELGPYPEPASARS